MTIRNEREVGDPVTPWSLSPCANFVTLCNFSHPVQFLSPCHPVQILSPCAIFVTLSPCTIFCHPVQFLSPCLPNSFCSPNWSWIEKLCEYHKESVAVFEYHKDVCQISLPLLVNVANDCWIAREVLCCRLMQCVCVSLSEIHLVGF